MTSKGILGIILTVIGALGLVFGAIGALDVYEVNQQLSQMNSAMGGMLSSMGSQMGVATEANYTRPIIFIVSGAVMLFFGVRLLKTPKETAAAE